jgi:hypothetical protein
MNKFCFLRLTMFLLAGIAAATTLSVSNGNASIAVDPGSVFGLSSYTVDGTEQIFEEWFWFRRSGDLYEQPLNNLSLTSAAAAGNQIQLSFAGDNLGVRLGYQLFGGTPGSDTAGLRETVVLQNPSNTALQLAWFMEADFDLDAFGGSDVIAGGLNGILQTDGHTTLAVSSSLTPSAFQAAPFPDLFLSLSDFSITNLDNSGIPFGPGDGTFAYQWNLSIPPNSSLTYTIDKNFIPEPATGELCVVVLGLLIAARWRGRNGGQRRKCE